MIFSSLLEIRPFKMVQYRCPETSDNHPVTGAVFEKNGGLIRRVPETWCLCVTSRNTCEIVRLEVDFFWYSGALLQLGWNIMKAVLKRRNRFEMGGSGGVLTSVPELSCSCMCWSVDCPRRESYSIYPVCRSRRRMVSAGLLLFLSWLGPLYDPDIQFTGRLAIV